jgi:hypothetical protein
MHLQDKVPDLGVDRRPSRPPASAFPAPVEAEAASMPAEDGLRLDEDESIPPPGPEPREAGPQEPIGGVELDPSARALAVEDEELVA